MVFDGAVDPANLGKGDWIYILSEATNHLADPGASFAASEPSVTNVQSLMDYEASLGMQWVTVKASSGSAKYPSDTAPQFTLDLVLAAHRAGLQIFGYNRSYGTDPTGEINIATWVYNLGADGLIMDAEGEWETTYNPPLGTTAQIAGIATNILKGIKALYPTKFMAHSPFMVIDDHSTFPYQVFGQYCDAVMPQDYWVAFGITPGNCITNWSGLDMETQWKKWQSNLPPPYNTLSIKPIAPIGEADASSEPGSDLTTFVNTLTSLPNPASITGYKGVSWYRAGLHSGDMLTAIQNANIGGPFPAKPPVPSVPTSLSATSPGGCFVNLIWTNAANANNYIISRSPTTGGPYTDMGSTLSTSYCDSASITSNTRYYYVVRAANVSGESASSTQASVLTPAPLYPASLTNLSATTAGCQINLTWSAADTNATYYTIARDTSAGGSFTNIIGSTTSTSYSDASGAQSTTYYYAVRAANLCGLSAANSPVASATTTAGCVAEIAMDNPSATFVGAWSTNSSAADKYLTNYNYCSTVTGAYNKSATYTPTIVTAGYYDIAVWYPEGSNRPTDASHYIVYDGGITNVLVDQTTTGGAPHLIARGLHFLAGQSGLVRINNQSAVAGKQVMADGVFFTYSSGNQTITFPPVTNVIYGAPAPIATASSGLPVTYTVTAGPAWVSNNIVIITNTGKVTIQADQPGGGGFFPAPSATLTFTVTANTLQIVPTATNSLILSWPVPAGGWVLEYTNALPRAMASWPQITPPYQTNATQAWVVLPAPTEQNYYRLWKP